MPQAINNYIAPGAYSTILLNPTVATSLGPPVVCVIGQGIRGPYGPYLYTDFGDVSNTYGPATQGNPLSLGCFFAFLNGASNVLAVNVQPVNSTNAYTTVALSSFPISSYTPAPSTALDAVSGQQVNTTGNVAGTFYIQDWNYLNQDPTYGTTASQQQAALAQLASAQSTLQYVELAGIPFVPLQNSQLSQIVVYTQGTSTPPLSSMSQGQWNQYNNCYAIFNAINAAYFCPATAQLLIPDTSPTTNGPIAGYSNLFNSIGNTVNTGSGALLAVLSTTALAQQYFVQHGGVLYIAADNYGTQHDIFYGLFDSNTATSGSTNTQAFGLTNFGSGQNNPYYYFHNGTDGAVTIQAFENALNLTDAQEADLIVMLNPSPGLQTYLLSDVTTQSSKPYRNERVGLVSGYTYDSYNTTITNVGALQGGPGSKRMMYLYPTSAFFNDPIQNRVVVLDGTYLAAALAGLMSLFDAAEPATHKVLSGFVDVGLHMSMTVANAIAQYGVCVIENNPQFGIRVRHGLSVDTTNVNTQEISVTRQLDYTVQSLRDAMEANFVGGKITLNTLGAATSLATTILTNLVSSQIIARFNQPTIRIDPQNPTRIQIFATVLPAYPCNYVDLYLTVDTASLTPSTTPVSFT